jgi:O-antigen ligase
VSAEAVGSPVARVLRLWLSPAVWVTIADVFAVLTALALPWSTSLVAIFVLCWLGSAALMLDYGVYLQSLKRPICFLPFALVALALVGTLWSDAPWGERLYAVSPTIKLLVLPGLFYHFERSSRGMWVFIAFLASCTLLMLMSWIVAFDPGLSLKPGVEAERGIFVKNYIDQSQEFALCAVALAYPIISLLRANEIRLAKWLGAISVGFVLNMAFVTVSRTAIVTIPIMLAVFALLHLRRRTSLIILGVTIVLGGVLWFTMTDLRWGPKRFVRDYKLYKTQNDPTSIGIRLEFWQKSLRFISEAPVIGNGTGATRGLFERAATGAVDSATGQVIGNPHNQTLNVAVQWGMIGVVLLYAMWLVHLLLFRGEGLVPWIGLLVVVQNIFTSLFNSHLFDFHEGWMYVLGVGVAGGMTLAAQRRRASTGSGGP